ncbi:MAG: hypothetical protein AABX38_05355 [Candidatus Micrarchaeota archaeon]
MEKGQDYKIKKLEKGPLQRFKNQNLLLKKFGEFGLQIYKVMTGKRTVRELQKDLDIEEDRFDSVMEYMEEAGMVELTIVESEVEDVKSTKTKSKQKEEAHEEPEEIEEPLSRLKKKEIEESQEEIEPETTEETRNEIEPEESKEELTEKEIEPESSEEIEIEKPVPKKKKDLFEEIEIKPEDVEIKPENEDEQEAQEEPAKEEVEIEPQINEEEISIETEQEEKKEESVEKEEEQEEELKIEAEEDIAPEQEEEKAEEISPVERIIKDKYGEIGIKVYALIDGQKTAEEIMNETGLSESKLVEILDFLDEQGIIKLEYPGSKDKDKEKKSFVSPQSEDESEFKPIIEEGAESDSISKDISPVEVPIKTSTDIIKSVKLKAKVVLKFGDKGSKIIDEADGKKDVIDIALKLDIPLYTVYDIIKYLSAEGGILLKPLTRAELKKKYGDDAFSIYKKYGREGVMLYELIGKELSIKQMAERVTKDKPKVVEIFIFIHQVLGTELPIDQEMLTRQLDS